MKLKACLLLALISGTSCADSSEPVPSAQVQLHEVAVLGGSMEDVSPHLSTRVAVSRSLGEARYWATPTYEPGFIHGYSADGTISARLGGPGEGPGELGGLYALLLQASDSDLFVGSSTSQRLTRYAVVDSSSSTETLPWPISYMAAIPDGRLLIVPSAQGEAPVVRSDSLVFDPVRLPEGFTVPHPGGIVAGSAESPRLGWLVPVFTGDVYSIDRDLNAVLEFSVALPDSANDRLSASITGITEKDGVLWICVFRRLSEIPSGAAFGPAMLDSIFDTQLIAVDIETGFVLGTYDDERMLQPVPGEGPLYSDVFETEIGDTRIAIYRPHLIGNGAR